MVITRRRIAAALALGLLPALLSVTSQGDASPPAAATAATPSYDATITRTEHGIPHIVAKDFGSLGFGSGYSAAGTSICRNSGSASRSPPPRSATTRSPACA